VRFAHRSSYARCSCTVNCIVIADPKTMQRANWLLWTAHNLERFADRITNICERTVFVVTGELAEIGDTDSEFWKRS